MRATANCLVILLVLYCVDTEVMDCTNCTGENCGKDCGGSTEVNQCPLKNLSISLPTNHCVTIEHGNESCVDNQPYIGSDIDPQANYWITCCNNLSCPDPTGSPSAPKLEVLTPSWTAVSLTMATLHLNWSAVVAHRHQLVITVNNGTNSTVRCMCLPASVLQYYVNVSLLAGTSLHVEMIGLPYSKTAGKKFTTNDTSLDIPSDCWDTDDKISSLERCGPTAPQNLNVTIVTVNESSVLLSINWEPPLTYNTEVDIIAYKIVYNGNKEVIVINQTSCQYNLTCPAVHKYIIEVYASYGEVNNSIDEAQCEEHNVTDSHVTLTLCWGQAAMVTKILPSTTPDTANSSKSEVVLIIIVSSIIILVLAVVVMIIISIIAFARLHKAAANRYLPLVVNGDNYAVRRVFIINAPQSNDEDLCLVRRLCHKLADNSVKPVCYEYSTFDRQHGPGQSGIYQWAEKNFTECDMTLFVCNKSFYDAWNNVNNTSDQNSLISASKLLLQGRLSMNSDDVSQFGVILLRHCDDQYIPSFYLRSLQKFIVFQNDQCVIEALLDQMCLF